MQKILGQKLVVIGLLGLVLWLPLIWIHNQIYERKQFMESVREDISASWTGTQTVMAPVLVVQYESSVRRAVVVDGVSTYKEIAEQRHLLIAADDAKVQGDMSTELRYKGIYGVPVYRTTMLINGHFASSGIANALTQLQQQKNFLNIKDAYLAVYVRDPRGIEGIPKISWQQQPLNFLPGAGLVEMGEGLRAPLRDNLLQSTAAHASLTFEVGLTLRGMEALHFVPSAPSFEVQFSSTWPHPEFSGAFLPVSREITPNGFTARWSVNEFSTGIADKLESCSNNDCSRLLNTQFGTTLFQSVDVYQQTERALKYALLFIGLTFIAFFIFETLQRVAIHPIQYSLVGLALVIFYLLLLSLSEHLLFAAAYAIAAAACCLLIGFYVRYVMHGWTPAILFTVALTALYGVLLVILRMEDYAQLTGAVLIFAMLAAAMILTRKMDWYALTSNNKTER